MDEQTIQEAAASFCKVPEIYQQIFKQAGADFPDELVKQIKQQPEQGIQMLKNNQDLLKNIVTIYSQYKDQIQGAMKQSKMFKEGGKLDYLINKFQEGGKSYNVRGDSFLDLLINKLTLGTKVNDYKGATNRRIKGLVDKNGNQVYEMSESYGGYEPVSTITITPKKDTLVRQKFLVGNGDRVYDFENWEDGYKSILDRFKNTGILDYVHKNFPQTVKK